MQLGNATGTAKITQIRELIQLSTDSSKTRVQITKKTKQHLMTCSKVNTFISKVNTFILKSQVCYLYAYITQH